MLPTKIGVLLLTPGTLGALRMPVYCPSCWSEINPGDDSCTHCSYWIRDFDNLSYEMKLLRALDHPIRETCMMAIQLLGELKSASALPAFNSILRTEEDIYVVREIVRSLARIGNDESLALLETLKSHRSSLVGKLAEELLHEANRSMPKGQTSSMPGPASC